MVARYARDDDRSRLVRRSKLQLLVDALPLLAAVASELVRHGDGLDA